MTRRIEILAYINSHPGSRSSNVQRSLDLSKNSVSPVLCCLWKDKLIKRDFENASWRLGFPYYITDAGKKYLEEQHYWVL